MEMNDNLAHLLAVELMAACQGVEFRRPLRPSPHLEAAIATVREFSPKLEDDRMLGAEISALAAAVLAGRLAGA
jgi:histidine ammonia-lyase